MKKFVEICFAIFYLAEIGVIHNVSGEYRKLLILCHAFSAVFFLSVLMLIAMKTLFVQFNLILGI